MTMAVVTAGSTKAQAKAEKARRKSLAAENAAVPAAVETVDNSSFTPLTDEQIAVVMKYWEDKYVRPKGRNVSALVILAVNLLLTAINVWMVARGIR